MKLAIITNSDIGLYNFRKEVVETFLKEPYEVHLLLPQGDYTDQFINLGCKYHPIDIDRRGMNPVKDLILMKQMYHIIKEIHPDVILTYTIKPNIYGGMICKKLHIPYITTITGLGSSLQNDNLSSKFISILYKLSVKQANWIFVQNKEIYNRLIQKKLISERSSIIAGSGVSLTQFRFSNMVIDTSIHFLFLGRIMTEKGITEFLEMANEIVQTNENVYFDIVGMKDDDISLDKYLSERIIYHGATDQPYHWYERVTCLINPSYHEGMSNVVLEACATGRPCLVSNIAGCKEIIEHGVQGFLFKPRSVESLKDVVYQFLKLSDEEKKQMGINARKKVEQVFDRNIVVQEYLNKVKEMEKI